MIRVTRARGALLSSGVGIGLGAWLFAAPAAIASGTSCGSPVHAGGEWMTYGHDAANSRSQAAAGGVAAAHVPSLSAAWVFSTAAQGDSSGSLQSTPIVANGCVFLGSASGVVYALNETTGAVLRRHQVAAPSPGLGGAIVGAPAVSGGRVYVLVDQTSAPYAVALDEHTGSQIWRSAPVDTYPGSYTNASAALYQGLLFFGYSPPEGDPGGSGGWALLNTTTGAIVNNTTAIPPADRAKGFGGGGIWSTPAFDRNGYAYVGAGNPGGPQADPNTDAILKIDVDRQRATFGQVVARYAGNPDQYTNTLQTLNQTPACAASEASPTGWPLDDPVCGQLDLDFGASPNLFSNAQGQELVGDLQKSGVYHAARASDMSGAWSTLVGLSCQACNAASTAYDGRRILGASAPGGLEYALDRNAGTSDWQQPLADGVHYQSTSASGGVVYTVDGNGMFDAFDAATGQTLLRRPMALDTGAPTGGLTSGAVAIADHTVFAATGEFPGDSQAGYLIAYR